MKDRTPRYPGRVRLTPTGAPNVFDMTREDDPIEAGTPLNKATFLTDETAALFGLGASALPDDVFSAIANGYAKIEIASYSGTGTFGVNNPSSITFSFAPKMVFALYLVSSSGTAAQIFGKVNYLGSAVMISDALSTNFLNERGFLTGTTSAVNYGKKSADGKTFYWYADNAGRQLNGAGATYHFLAIG